MKARIPCPAVFSFPAIFLIVAIFLLSACGGGGSDNPASETQTKTVSGGGVKGPLANAAVSVYKFDSTQPGFKGQVAATGSTNSNAAITDLTLPSPVAPPYIMEFTSTPGITTDITSGQFPVITTLRTVITQLLLDTGEPLYATPLTTMAVDIAVANAIDNNGTTGIQAEEFETALTIAASQVVSTVGFGMDASVDIFDTPPLVDDTTTSTSKQTMVAAYRAAVEAVTAIAFQIKEQNAGGADSDTVLAELAADLADGGGINGSAGSTINAQTLQIFQQDPATLSIPNTTSRVGDIRQILVTESVTTAPGVTVAELDTGGSISIKTTPGQTNPDLDGDNVLNSQDAFPLDPNESVDSDGDGIGDNADPDDNNNGILDVDEGSTANPTATDTDGDGIDTDIDNCPNVFNPAQTNTDSDAEGDACDNDDDNDGVPDTSDAFPLTASESIDTDGDGTGNNADTDDDNDGVNDVEDTGVSPVDSITSCSLLRDCDGDGVFDAVDAFPLDSSEQHDTDGDGTGNNSDTDDDNDGVSDSNENANGTKPLVADTDGDGVSDGLDALPLDPGESVDTDGDGTGNNADTDDDNDGVLDTEDAFPLDASESVDTDGDGTGNNADTDDDNDGLSDSEEAALGTNPLLVDTDGDTVGDASDNCPLAVNTDQINTDGADDGGDICDTDDDNDGVADTEDAFPLDASEWLDTDSDGIGNNADPDDDNDGFIDGEDAFPLDVTEWLDTDGDGIGNNADPDDDNDGLNDSEEAGLGTNPLQADSDDDTVGDATDNCPLISNSDQTNTDGAADGGDACDPDDDNDGFVDGEDAFPLDVTEWIDTDGDGTGNNADTDDDNDGLSDGEESARGTNPLRADTDSDTVGDASDNCPLIANADQTNTDGAADGGNACDPDDDNDGVLDTEDAFPLDSSESVDTDGDGTGNNADTDDDNDGVADTSDAFPLDASESVDTDGDGTGNNADTDDDNDGVTDTADAFPLDATESVDTDGDGTGNNADTDDDNDGVADSSDAFPLDASESVDTDGDGTGNNADTDDDNDGVADTADAFPLDATESVDTDGDGTGNNADTDDDNDGVADSSDAFPLDASESVDTDGDGTGNNADTDDDNDGVADTADAFPLDATESVDTDGDGTGNNADIDDDNDGVADSSDAFPLDASESIDTDGDGTGNNADTDDDNDTVPDTTDNCPLIANTDQADSNGNGIGDACDNAAPVVEQTAPLAVIMDEDGAPQGFIAPTISATDAESDTLTWSTPGAAHGTATVSGTGATPAVLSYVPNTNFNGDDSFTVNVSDGINTVGIVVNVTINPQNDAPTISGTPLTTATEGAAYSFIPGGGDVDTGDTLTYSITGQPSWASFNNTTGELYGTPQTGDANVYGPIVISVDDGTDNASLPTFNITVSAPVGTAISMADLLGPTEGGLFNWESWVDPTGFNRFSINTFKYDVNSSTLVDEEGEFVNLFGEFVTQTFQGDVDLTLSTNGLWEPATAVRVTSISSGNDGLAMDVTLNSASDEVMESLRLSAKYVDISGDPIASQLEPLMQSLMFDPNAVFPQGSKLITQFNIENLSDAYHMSFDEDCTANDLTTLNGNCNAIYTTKDPSSYATTLEQVIQASTWINPGDGTLPPERIYMISNAANSTELQVRLVSGGVANFYTFDFSDITPVVSSPTAGTWVRDASVQGIDMIRFQVPSSLVGQFPQLQGRLDPTWVLTVQNGYVRIGDFSKTGDIANEQGGLNGIARDAILSNFSGIQITEALAGTTSYAVYLDASGQYMMDIEQHDANGVLTVTNYENGTVEPLGTWEISAPGILHTTLSGVDYWYKVVALDENGGFWTCGSTDANDPLNCTLLDIGYKFGLVYFNPTVAVGALNALNAGSSTSAPFPVPLRNADGSRSTTYITVSSPFTTAGLDDTSHTLNLPTGESVTINFTSGGTGTIEHSATEINSITWNVLATGILKIDEFDSLGNQWNWTIGNVNTTAAGNVLVQLTTPSLQTISVDIFVLGGFDQAL